jgi:hypothetical protein
VVVVATDGSDANPGTLAQPLATLTAAVARVASWPIGRPATIVVRGGLYRQGGVTINGGRAVTVIAHPGEVPVFTGAAPLTGPWTAQDGTEWHAYTPQPVTDGSGIAFTGGQNLNGDGVGRFPDQVWVGERQLRQVSTLAQVAPGTFFVDRSTGRVHLHPVDRAAGPVEASSRPQFVRINGADTTVEGLRITRYSNNAASYGVVLVGATAHRSTLRDVEIRDAAYQAVQYAGNTSPGQIVENARLERVTIADSGWMGVSATLVAGLTVSDSRITGMNVFDEFSHAPQSGAMKTSRVRDVVITGSRIEGNHSHGLWFDQSNVGVTIAGTDVIDNDGSGVFFEISDRLLMVNTYVRAGGGERAVKIAGATGVRLVNNTIVGGADPLGVYVDSRSKPGCADPARPLCEGSLSSDRDTLRPRPATLDWMLRIDLMVDNVIGHPSGTGYCGARTAWCITASNAGATIPVASVLHPADATRGIPASALDGNVFATDGGVPVMRHATGSVADTAALRAWLAATTALPGQEPSGRSGTGLVRADGAPTAALASLHHTAAAVPADPAINVYAPAGARQYGAARNWPA